MKQNIKQDPKVLFVTARILQFCADVFAVFGLFMVAFIYFTHFKGQVFDALSDPTSIALVITSFLPAAVMAWQASKKRKQAKTLLERSRK
jgi:hypothetical protein